MLSKKNLRKSDQRDCRLLKLPAEITLSILKFSGLKAADVACFMLTCKAFAALICSFTLEPKMETQLQSGKEDEIMDRVQWEGDDEWFSDDSEAASEALAALHFKFDARTNMAEIDGLLKRLDSGWNQSDSRLCVKCKVFRTTKRSDWNKKVQNYLYKSNAPAAQGYRIMEDCRCQCSSEDVIERWIARGQHKNTILYVSCPVCVFGNTHAYSRCCDCCDDDPSGCGCNGCACSECEHHH